MQFLILKEVVARDWARLGQAHLNAATGVLVCARGINPKNVHEATCFLVFEEFLDFLARRTRSDFVRLHPGGASRTPIRTPTTYRGLDKLKTHIFYKGRAQLSLSMKQYDLVQAGQDNSYCRLGQIAPDQY